MWERKKNLWQWDFAKIVLDNGNTCLGTGRISDQIHHGTEYRISVFFNWAFVNFYPSQEKIHIVSEEKISSEVTF